VALVLLVALLPLFFIILLGCVTFQGKPILFTQKRVGFKFVNFTIFKFRSMEENNSRIIHNFFDENRITNWGKIIRFLKLDEIPQLINIIKGEMVFVGPRAEIPEFVNHKKFKFLKNIKPGLTDFSSILLRHENKVLNKIGGHNAYLQLLPLKIALADYYIQHNGYFTDFKIIIYTITSIFFPKIINRSIIVPQLKKDLPEWSRFLSKYCI